MGGLDGMGASPDADPDAPDPGRAADAEGAGGTSVTAEVARGASLAGVGAEPRPDAAPALEPVAAGSLPTSSPDAGPMLGVYCPFLASIDVEDRVRRATPAPDTANRCLSSGEPVAPSARDQAALCLSGGHQACRRYVNATARAREEASVPAPGPRVSAPIAAAAGVLVLAAVLAGASLAVNGDLSLGLGAPAASSAPSAAVAGGGPAGSPDAGAVGSPAPSVPAVAPVSSLPASTAAVPAVTSTPAPTPSLVPRPSTTPRSYPGLTPCPGRDDCYIYVVKRGDVLAAVAARYGLSLDEVLARNPKIRDPGLIVLGQKIRLPTPRR